MDDILRYYISRSCLGAKDECKRSYWLLAALDLKVLVDDIKSIHLLSLVLVKSLNLNVENGIRINLYVLVLLEVSSELFFLGQLDSFELVKNFNILDVIKELLELVSILLEAVADCL